VQLKINWGLGVVLMQMTMYFFALSIMVTDPAAKLYGFFIAAGAVFLLMVAASMIDKLNRPDKYDKALRKSLLRLYKTGRLTVSVLAEIKRRFPDLLPQSSGAPAGLGAWCKLPPFFFNEPLFPHQGPDAAVIRIATGSRSSSFADVGA
jgi:hypothetical protein